MIALTIEQRRSAIMMQNGLNRRDTDAKRYSHLEMEAALNVWECLLEAFMVDVPHGHDEPERYALPEAVQAYRDEFGVVELRSRAVTIAAWCLRVYEAMTPGEVEGHAYDWEVIPAMCRRISFDSSIGPVLPDIVLTAQAVAEELNPRRPDTPDA